MALSSGAANQNATTSRILNKLNYALSNVAADITTATTSDIVLMLDADDNYEVKYGDSANMFEAMGITSTASELNILDGVTATAAELNYNDIATLGTGAASKAVVLDASGDYTYPASGTIVYPSGATLTLQSGSTFNAAGTFQIGGAAVGATAAEINAVADVSARVQELTATGAVTAGVVMLEVNHISTVIAATVADAALHAGVPFTVRNTSASGTAAHTVTLTSGTWNGTNAVATLDAPGESITAVFDSAGNGIVIDNTGTVGLSG